MSSVAPLPAVPAVLPLRVRDLGRQPYEPVWRAMQEFTTQRDADSADELWVLQHDPVFTLGQSGKREHVLAPGEIPLVEVDRGGQVTYHGPGQLVVYPLLDLRRLGLGVRALVNCIEQAVIDTLDTWNIIAHRQAGAPGVYVAGAKIAALGLRLRRGCSLHGLAFNVDMDLEPFSRINPCGHRGLQVVRMVDFGGPSSLAAVQQVLVKKLVAALGMQAVDADCASPIGHGLTMESHPK